MRTDIFRCCVYWLSTIHFIIRDICTGSALFFHFRLTNELDTSFFNLRLLGTGFVIGRLDYCLFYRFVTHHSSALLRSSLTSQLGSSSPACDCGNGLPVSQTHTVTPHTSGCCNKKVKASHTRYRALGPELIPVYWQSAQVTSVIHL